MLDQDEGGIRDALNEFAKILEVGADTNHTLATLELRNRDDPCHPLLQGEEGVIMSKD